MHKFYGSRLMLNDGWASDTATQRRSALRVEPTQQINLALQREKSLRLGNRLHRQNLVRKAIAE